MTSDEPLVLGFASADEWELWLEREHARPQGVWLKIAKRDSGVASVSYAEAVQSALCFGWIDGQVRRFDERFYIQLFTPRRKRSRWSKINREKAQRLIAAGRMRPAGMDQVRAARADGRWEAAYDGANTMAIPEDLQRALDANPTAAAFFASLRGSNRYAILYRVHDAKRPQTRARRIAQYVEMCARGQTLHP
jgi:uncharacterized protein YdeI (YjbR/CyaY-like superfamily)